MGLKAQSWMQNLLKWSGRLVCSITNQNGAFLSKCEPNLSDQLIRKLICKFLNFHLQLDVTEKLVTDLQARTQVCEVTALMKCLYFALELV